MYTLYVHTFPNKKRYVGVTSQTPEKRFGKNGNGYRSKILKEEIQKYGWDNIEHKIIKTNLSYEDAIKYEILYIKKYNSSNKEFGYNIEGGGGFCKNPKTYVHKNTPNRQIWYDKQKNTPLPEPVKKKIRLALLKRFNHYICQYEDGKLIKKWNSLSEIKNQYGYDRSYIGLCCNYNKNNYPYKKAYNYVWTYEKREDI